MITSAFRRAKDFVLRDVWLAEPLPGWRGAPLYLARTLVLVAEGVWKQELLVRAAALTFKVTFSLVPFLAVVLAFFKAFGGLERTAGDVRDFLMRNLVPEARASEIVQRLTELIDRMDAAAVGIIGFAILLYTSVSMLTTVEQAFNVIWGVRRPRPLLRRITVYWTILTIGPICLALSLSASTFVQSQAAYRWLVTHVPLAETFLFTLAPFVLIWVIFAAMYKIMPNTPVPLKAALAGAVVAGTAWEILKRLWVLFNARIFESYQVYGPLSAIPVFLLWIYFSWILVLFGAEVAFAAQHVRTYRREMEAPQLSQAFKERLALRLMVELARDFMAGRDPATAEDLSRRLRVPVRACNDVLFHLSGQRLVREISNAQSTSFVPAEDLDRITARRVVDAIRRSGHEPTMAEDGTTGERLHRILTEAEDIASKHLDRATLRELATHSLPPPEIPNA